MKNDAGVRDNKKTNEKGIKEEKKNLEKNTRKKEAANKFQSALKKAIVS